VQVKVGSKVLVGVGDGLDEPASKDPTEQPRVPSPSNARTEIAVMVVRFIVYPSLAQYCFTKSTMTH
jgi:hypothetical protein